MTRVINIHIADGDRMIRDLVCASAPLATDATVRS
jgi:hypothetical protein